MYNVTSINDLSDNGKSFEFGYDSENDTYGYYKNGVFTGFGGGGLSTKCIVKGGYWFSSNIVGQISMFVDDDGSVYTANNTSDFERIVTDLSFIRSIRWYSSPRQHYPTVDKDGYYLLITYNGYAIMPSFYTAGTELPMCDCYYFGGLLYFGMEVPN